MRAAAEAKHEELRRALGDTTRLVDEMKPLLEASFQRHSNDAAERAVLRLTEIVKPQLEGNAGRINSALDTKKVEIESLLTPVRQMLEAYRAEVLRSDASRSESHATLTEQLRGLLDVTRATQAEASKLGGALRSPGVAGSWGENSLRNCVELAGMNEFCDFDVQLTFTADDRNIRPDMIIRLPDDRAVAVDAKAPVTAFMEALDATDEPTRRSLLEKHAKNFRRHIDDLSRREYPERIQAALGRQLSFTVLFVGGEQFLSSAMMSDPALFEYAASRNIVIASPTILVPLLKALATGWKAERLEEDAQNSLRAAQNLYDQFVRVFESINAVGRTLDSLVVKYNSAIGSIDHLVPKARQLGERLLSNKEVPDTVEIDRDVRESVKLRAQALLPFGTPRGADDSEEEVNDEEDSLVDR